MPQEGRGTLISCEWAELHTRSYLIRGESVLFCGISVGRRRRLEASYHILSLNSVTLIATPADITNMVLGIKFGHL